MGTRLARELAAAEAANDSKMEENLAAIKEQRTKRGLHDYEQEFEQYVLALGDIGEAVAPFLNLGPTDWRGGDPAQCAASRVVGEAVAAAYGVPVHYDDPAAIIAYATGKSMRDVQGVQGFYCSEPESIVINAALGPEAKTFALWHEIGHLMFGHQIDGAMPETDIGDLTNPLHGVRSFEYMADAFSMTMLQRTGVTENRFCRFSSTTTMFRFEKHYEAATRVDFDETKDYDSLTGALTNLDIPAAIARKQEFLRANWPLLIDKADEAREVVAGLRDIERKAYPAVIPPSQQSTPEERQAIARQRFRQQHAKEIAEVMGDIAPAAPVQARPAPTSPVPTPDPAIAQPPTTPAARPVRPQPLSIPPPALAAAVTGPQSQEDKVKALEATVATLGQKLQGALSRARGTAWPREPSQPGPPIEESEDEVRQMLTELGL